MPPSCTDHRSTAPVGRLSKCAHVSNIDRSISNTLLFSSQRAPWEAVRLLLWSVAFAPCQSTTLGAQPGSLLAAKRGSHPSAVNLTQICSLDFRLIARGGLHN